jgi:hypothetical protein
MITNNRKLMIFKKNLVILILLVLPLLSQGQQTNNRNFKLGFTTSPNWGWMSFPSNSDLQDVVTERDGSRVGFSYGLLGDFGFSDNYYFSSAFTVTTINAKTKSINPNSVSLNTYKLQYLEIPLTLKLKSTERNDMRYFGQFGISTGINIGAKRDTESKDSNGNPVSEKNQDVGDAINTFRLGLIFGGGTEWKLGQNLNLLTGVSYNNGFTDVFDSNEKGKNSYLSLNLGIFF